MINRINKLKKESHLYKIYEQNIKKQVKILDTLELQIEPIGIQQLSELTDLSRSSTVKYLKKSPIN